MTQTTHCISMTHEQKLILPNILIISEDQEFANSLKFSLEDSFFQHVLIKISDYHKYTQQEEEFSVVIVDYPIGHGNSIDGIQTQMSYPYVICLGEEDQKESLKEAVLSGAYDYFIKDELSTKALVKSVKLAALKSQAQKVSAYSSDSDEIAKIQIRPDLSIVGSNRSAQGLLESSKTKINGLTLSHFFTDDAISKIKEGIENNNIPDGEVTITFENGKSKYCLLHANIEEQWITLELKDISSEKIDRDFKKAQEIAARSQKMKERFLAGVSHEMRTPMNAIYGMSNLLLKTLPNEEQLEYISSIKQSSEILLGIINDILDISSMQNGQVEFVNDDFDLKALLDNVVNVMQFKAKEKALNFSLHIDPRIPRTIKGDKLRLNQILINLVGNAIKFTNNGFVKIMVESASDDSFEDIAFIKFSVIDSGMGIPEDQKDSIFENFTKIRDKDTIIEGTGLGLSITKELIEQQGGKIGVESALGEGSKFFFDLFFEVGDPALIAAMEYADTTSNTVSTDVIKLLLVEDHKMNQLVARKTLEKQYENMDISIANDGKEAVEIIQSGEFDIVLMDIQMPVMNGEEATQYIRSQLNISKLQLPILAMTAHATISKDDTYKEHGFNDFVLKPFVPQELFSKITKYTKPYYNASQY